MELTSHDSHNHILYGESNGQSIMSGYSPQNTELDKTEVT